MGTILTMLLELDKDASRWRSIRLFSVLTTQKEFKNATITGHFRFVFDENSVREITWLALRHLYEKLRFQYGFRAHENEKTTLPYSSGLKSVLEKLRFLERLVWTVGRTVEINLHFQISPAYGRCHVEKLFKEKKTNLYLRYVQMKSFLVLAKRIERCTFVLSRVVISYGSDYQPGTNWFPFVVLQLLEFRNTEESTWKRTSVLRNTPSRLKKRNRGRDCVYLISGYLISGILAN